MSLSLLDPSLTNVLQANLLQGTKFFIFFITARGFYLVFMLTLFKSTFRIVVRPLEQT